MSMTFASPLVAIALFCALMSLGILGIFLVKNPPLSSGSTRLWLFLGLGVFPIGVASTGNLNGFEVTKSRAFCGSCHVMVPHALDSNNRESLSLASRHARNRLFGEENCYVCHADYGMFGTMVTKAGGMKHVWMYYTKYMNTPIEEALSSIRLYKPYPNDNCMQCHSTELSLWKSRLEHRSLLDEIRHGTVSCASGACHGEAHPFSKTSSSKPSTSSNSVDGPAR